MILIGEICMTWKSHDQGLKVLVIRTRDFHRLKRRKAGNKVLKTGRD